MCCVRGPIDIHVNGSAGTLRHLAPRDSARCAWLSRLSFRKMWKPPQGSDDMTVARDETVASRQGSVTQCLWMVWTVCGATRRRDEALAAHVIRRTVARKPMPPWCVPACFPPVPIRSTPIAAVWYLIPTLHPRQRKLDALPAVASIELGGMGRFEPARESDTLPALSPQCCYAGINAGWPNRDWYEGCWKRRFGLIHRRCP